MSSNDMSKPFNLRIPVELREWLDAEARKNMRSVNAEILFKLLQAKELQATVAGNSAGLQ